MEECLYIIIPAYNEAENIMDVINDWYPIIENKNYIQVSGAKTCRLVIIDDGSSDETYNILCDAAKTRPYLTPIHKENSGHGATVLYGYKYALEHGADFVFQTDSDGQTSASEFEKFWFRRNDYDMVIGWRDHRQDGFSRKVVTKVLKMVIRLCFGVTITDANTPYRLMKSEPLKEAVQMIPDDFNLSNVLLSVIYAKKRRSVRFLPISFKARQGGVNSINLRKIIKIGKKALQDFHDFNEKFEENLEDDAEKDTEI